MTHSQQVLHDVRNEASLSAFLSLRNQITFPQLGRTQQFSPGIHVFQQGAPADEAYFVASGIVKMTVLGSGGREFIVSLRGAGWLLGAASAILNETYETSALTLTKSRLQRIPARDLRKLLKSNAEFSSRVHEIHAWEARANLERLASLATQSARARLTTLLTQVILGSRPELPGQECMLNMPLKQWELAQLLAISPEHINRLLRNLEHDGLVRRKKSIIIISDPRRLIALSAEAGLRNPPSIDRDIVHPS